jgi:hypothetical protein
VSYSVADANPGFLMNPDPELAEVLQTRNCEKEFLLEQNIFHIKKAIKTFMNDFRAPGEVSSLPKKTSGVLKQEIPFFPFLLDFLTS